MAKPKGVEAEIVALSALTGPAVFKPLFSDGMRLVDDFAEYVDSQAHKEQKDTELRLLAAYLTEESRLTAIVLQLISWLFLERAIQDGEYTTRASGEMQKVGRHLPPAKALEQPLEFNAMPEELRVLMARATDLNRRVKVFQGALDAPAFVNVSAPRGEPGWADGYPKHRKCSRL